MARFWRADFLESLLVLFTFRRNKNHFDCEVAFAWWVMLYQLSAGVIYLPKASSSMS